MPLPAPKKNEEESKFVSRCMASDVIQKDFKTQEQRLAVCYQQYKKRKKSAKGEVLWEDQDRDGWTYLV